MKEDIDILDRLGDFVKLKRTELGWTQKELAEKIGMKGIDFQYISKLENKKLPGMTRATLEEFLSALGANVYFE